MFVFFVTPLKLLLVPNSLSGMRRGVSVKSYAASHDIDPRLCIQEATPINKHASCTD